MGLFVCTGALVGSAIGGLVMDGEEGVGLAVGTGVGAKVDVTVQEVCW